MWDTKGEVQWKSTCLASMFKARSTIPVPKNKEKDKKKSVFVSILHFDYLIYTLYMFINYR